MVFRRVPVLNKRGTACRGQAHAQPTKQINEIEQPQKRRRKYGGTREATFVLAVFLSRRRCLLLYP